MKIDWKGSFGGGPLPGLLHGELRSRIGLQAGVGNGGAAADRAPVGPIPEPLLGPVTVDLTPPVVTLTFDSGFG